MTFHEKLVKDFEALILCGKRQLSQNERIIFRSAISQTVTELQKLVGSRSAEQFQYVQEAINNENRLFSREVERYRAFHCDCPECERSLTYGQA